MSQKATKPGSVYHCLSIIFFQCVVAYWGHFYVLLVFTGRIATKRQTAGFRFTHRPKIRFFAPQGRLTRCTDSRQTWQGRRSPRSAWLCKIFHLSRQREVGMRPQKYQKFPLFGKESPRRGNSLDRFRKFLGAFIRLTILH